MIFTFTLPRTKSRVVSATVIILLSLALTITPVSSGVALATSDDDYNVTVPSALETPERTTSFDGNDYTATGLAERTPGQSLSASVTVPDGESFTVDFLTGDGKRETYESGTGSESVSFDTSSLEPGTYFLALDADDDGNDGYADIYPIVISGYDVSLEYASKVHPDDDLEVTIDISETAASGSPAGVEIAVWNEDTAERIPAQKTSDGTYQASASGLEEGSYNVYAIAQGSDQVRGEPEILGVGAGGSLEVTESASTPEPPANEDGDENNVTETPTDEPTETESENATETEPTPTDDGTATENTSDSTETETEQNVVTPNQETETESNDTGADTNDDDDSQPEMAVPILAAVLLLVTLGLRITTRRSS